MKKHKKDSYESGVATINDGRFNHLNIGRDCSEQDMSNPAEAILVFTFSPDLNKHEHSHVQLDYKKALKLKKFIDGYIEEVYSYHEGKK